VKVTTSEQVVISGHVAPSAEMRNAY